MMKWLLSIMLIITFQAPHASDLTDVYKSVKYKSGKRAVSCRKLDLKNMQLNAQCVTTKGVIYKLVRRTSFGKSIWKDMSTGLHWSESGLCPNDLPDGKLGQKEDLPLAELNGIRQILAKVKPAQVNC